MSYFSEIEDYRTYLGKEEDFHFSYNANTGGGQSFLGGKFRGPNGTLCPTNVLNGRVALFQFAFGEGGCKSIGLDDPKTKYEIKPRATGDTNMKLAVGRNATPSKAIATFFMLPNTCGVKKTANFDTSVLCQENFWLQSMWLDVDMSAKGIALLKPKDCIFCGGVGEDGGTLRCFSFDFSKRIADVLRLYENSAKLETQVADCIKIFGDIYSGAAAFEYDKCATAVQDLMEFLKEKYPAEYSGVSDPLDFIVSHMADQTLDVKRDALTVALTVFKKKRDKINADIWPSFDAWAKDARQTFSVVDENQIVDPAFDYSHFVRFVFSSRQRTAFSKFDDSQKAIVGKFLREERSSSHAVSWYIDPANKVAVDGVGAGVMLYFMMMVRPDEFATWSGKMDEGLCLLGLRKDAAAKDLDVPNYEANKALQQTVMQKMHEMGIGKAADDASPADYLTVNEFLWFVTANEKDIKNEVQKMKLTDPNPNAKNAGKKKWADVLSDKPDEMMNRLIAALLTKPFAILTGASGTGKSRMVRRLAFMTCLNTQLQPDPTKKKAIENFRMVQVKPNWHDSSELLGYKSAVSATSKYVSTDFVRFLLKAHAFPQTPFFVCLDEMNLAPVEHYFAEFLSASESSRFEDGEWITDAIIDPGEFGGDINNLDPSDYAIPSPRKELIEKIGLFIPHNLFVVGTVNMDDSTSGFSRKVLDRAMTLEMDEVHYEDLQKPSQLSLFDEKDAAGNVISNGLLLGANEIEAFIKRCQFEPGKLDDVFRDKLTLVKDNLFQTPLAVAHRFARESVQYREALQTLFDGKGITDFDEYAIDHMMLMKVLPRLEGNKDELGDLLSKLKVIFGALAGHKISSDKLERMETAAGMNGGYFSFYL